MTSIPLAITLALGAAGLHALWNVLLKSSGDPLRLATKALCSSALLSTPLVIAAWVLAGRPGITSEGWLLAGISGVLEVAYFVFLSRAYRLGELSVVYPLARGLAPLLLVVAGLVLLRERLSVVSLAGVACLLAGILAIRPPLRAGRATVPALLTGVTIAAYSTVDKIGVSQTAPWLYGWVVWVVSGVLLAVLGVLVSNRSKADSVSEIGWPTAVTVGLLMTFTYTLILFALRLAPLAIVAPVRESAIVLVTAWGIWRLRERDGAWIRLGGAVAIIVGITVLAVVE
jgi:drug/metabolite transporter (DMT)-like permease